MGEFKRLETTLSELGACFQAQETARDLNATREIVAGLQDLRSKLERFQTRRDDCEIVTSSEFLARLASQSKVVEDLELELQSLTADLPPPEPQASSGEGQDGVRAEGSEAQDGAMRIEQDLQAAKESLDQLEAQREHNTEKRMR